MNAKKIETKKVYEIAVGKNATTVKVVNIERRVNGQLVFDCINTKTGKPMRIADAARFLKEVKTEKAPKGTKSTKSVKPDGLLSGLDAAHKVLVESGRPMRVKEIAEIAIANGYCKLNGATPEFTISAAMQREINRLGDASRVVKAERGSFAAR
jgi:hypothetical protein